MLLKDVEAAATAAAAEAVKNKGRVHVRCTKYFLMKFWILFIFNFLGKLDKVLNSTKRGYEMSNLMT